MTQYEIVVLVVMAFMNGVCSVVGWSMAVLIIRNKGFADALKEGIQDGDKVFHWKDIKAFGAFLAGIISALFTMNITGVFLFVRWFDVGPIAVVGLFIAVTFALFGIAWKK